MDKDKTIDYWVQTSDRDYHTVKSLFDSGDYHWALFIGHLVLEKLFKAVYGRRSDWTRLESTI